MCRKSCNFLCVKICQKHYLVLHSENLQLTLSLVHVSACFHSHWHSVVELLHGLVVDGDGHLRVSVKGELDVVAGTVLARGLVTRQLEILAASSWGKGQRWAKRRMGMRKEARYDSIPQCCDVWATCMFGWVRFSYRTSRSVSLRMFIRLRSVFTGSWGGGAA